MGRSANFARRTVTIPVGRSHTSVEHEWTDALVIVASGEIEIECTAGGRRRFDCGAVLWLAGLEVRRIHNVGPDDATLVAITRRRGPPPPPVV